MLRAVADENDVLSLCHRRQQPFDLLGLRQGGPARRSGGRARGGRDGAEVELRVVLADQHVGQALQRQPKGGAVGVGQVHVIALAHREVLEQGLAGIVGERDAHLARGDVIDSELEALAGDPLRLPLLERDIDPLRRDVGALLLRGGQRGREDDRAGNHRGGRGP